MRIHIFTDADDLVAFLRFQGSEEPLSVLDFSGDAGVKDAAGDRLLPPVSFTPEEKERIMDEYVEAVSEIGALNRFSLHWLCHPMSEKNDLVPNNLFDRLIRFLSFRRILSNTREGTLLVLTQDVPLFEDIFHYLTANRVNFGLSGLEPREKGTGFSLKKLYSFFLEAAQVQYRYMKSRSFWRNLDKTETYTVIRTWFDSRSPGLIADAEDVYFGRFPRFLKENGHHILYFGEFGHGFEFESQNLKKDLNHPVVLGRSLIHGLDYLRGYLFFLSVKRKLRLKTGLKILDTGVDIVFFNYFRRHCRNPHIRTNYFTYRAVGKLVKKLKIDRFYMPFENYAWEKLTRAAVSKYARTVKVIAFQHAQVALNAAKFFLGKEEGRSSLLPDTIVTLGEVTRDFLVRKKNYPPEILKTGCALRHDYSIPGAPAARKRNKRILVQLWSFEKSVQLVNFIYASGIHMGDGGYRVTLNPHPCHPMTKLIPHLDFEYRGQFEIASGTLGEAINACDLVIYHGTTTCLDALAGGVPVIDVEFGDFITVDPLFDFHDFKWRVEAPGELVGVIEKIYALSDEDFYRGQKKGFEFVSRYFYPVTVENLKTFL